MEHVNDIVGTSLSAIFQLRRLSASGAARPETLHKYLRGYIDELIKRATAEGFNQADAQDMAYAVVAFADEVALGLSDAIREYWLAHLLQFQFFRENQAGEAFFARLKKLRGDPNRTAVLQVYFLVLSFGFQGKHGVTGGELELMSLQEELARELGRTLPRGFEEDVLSEHGERPAEATVAAKQSWVLLGLAGGAVALAIVFFIAFKVLLSSAVGDVARLSAAVNPARKAAPAAPHPGAAE